MLRKTPYTALPQKIKLKKLRCSKHGELEVSIDTLKLKKN